MVGRLSGFDTFGSEDFWGGQLKSPLRALWNTEKVHKGGFYHDGRFATLGEVVDHYDSYLGLNLTDQAKSDLIEYLKSI